MVTVWEANLDEKYECRVNRTKPYTGVLTITEDGKELFSKDVSIAYDAQFGPDVSDVMEWQDICVEFIDG